MVSYCELPVLVNDETIIHLFFGCHMARLLWRIIFITFGLIKPNNVVHLFGSWLQGFTWDSKKIMFTGLCVLLWSIWLSRNDVVFHNTQKQNVLQILFRATYLTRTWAILQKGGGQRLDCRCMPRLGSDGDGHLCAEWVAV